MKQPYTPLLKVVILLFSISFYQTSNSQPILEFTSIVTGLSNPVDIVQEPGSSRLFIVEQGGTIRIANGSTLVAEPFLDISTLLNLTGSERGLLSMAFHPNYLNPANRYIFVYYTNTAGSITLARYQRDASSADSANWHSGVVLLTISKSFANHNGGKLIFGTDGNLYFGTGDGGSSDDPANNAQNGNSLLGKMLRLNVDAFTTAPYYTIPSDNPFTGASPIRDEVWALGLRNPWRWSFDRSNGDLWIADVGQNDWEEVNHVTAAIAATGLNYGWHCREGLHANPNISACTPTGGTNQDPIFEYTHNSTTGGFSITGGYVYRGSSWPALNGYYVTADYVSGNVWLLRPDGTFAFQDDLPGNISGFGEDSDGELYAIGRTAGIIYSIGLSAVLPVDLVRFTGKRLAGYNELRWTTAFEENTQKFIIEYSTDGRDFLMAGEVAASSNRQGDSYSFKHFINNNSRILYRLRMMDIDQTSRYSAVISISSNNDREIKIYPTIITSYKVEIISGPAIESITIYSIDGKQLFTKAMNGTSGYFNFSLPTLRKGMYLLRLVEKDFQQTEKIIIR